MKYISTTELRQKQDQNENLQIIDVREPYEFEDQNIGGLNIPLDEVITKINELAKDKPVIFCCKSGKRSTAIVSTLERKFGLNNLYSLEGGLTAYFE